MRIDTILCSEDTADKLETKHQLDVEEAEEVLWNNPHVRLRERGRRVGEDLYMAYGQTDAGRYLTVLFIYKPVSDNRPQSQALIISARDMMDKERKQYERK